MPGRWTLLALAIATAVAISGALAAFLALPQDLLLPLQRWLAPPRMPAEALSDLQARCLQLAAENAALRERLRQYAEIAGESGLPPPRVVAARGRVVARTQRTGRRFVELDVGSADGVVRDAPVVDGWRLVGVVVGVRERRCLVRELADSESRVPAAILGPEGLISEGVLSGSGLPGTARLAFVEDREGRRIEPGMAVVSARDAALPYGLAIGRIAQATRGARGEHWRIEVELLADSARTDSLLVLRVPPPAAAAP
ncbi:MAG: rod shape-determining protein MreC [Planctomycetota bacterium]|nr:hypothetical protein [Planctomycetota bacterium]MCX8040035.1 hypothetical protein [Planctomycetota bacterium]MDW8372593.1 rod shape-determining protein MreC [Planctomycetota bacterium]